MYRIAVVMQFGATLVAYGLIGVCFLLFPRTSYAHPGLGMIRLIVCALSATSFLSGLALLLKKQPTKTGVVIAVSTIASLLLLLLSMMG
jgi:hypothetical protein